MTRLRGIALGAALLLGACAGAPPRYPSSAEAPRPRAAGLHEPGKAPAPRATPAAGGAQPAPTAAAAPRRSVRVVRGPARRAVAPTGPWIWDVGDLTRGVRDYPGRELDLSPSGQRHEAPVSERDPAPVIEADALVDLIRRTVAPDTWDEEGNSIRVRDGKLVVRHSGETGD